MKRKPRKSEFLAPTRKDGSTLPKSNYGARVASSALDVEGFTGAPANCHHRQDKRTLRVRKCTPPRLTTKGA
jgi:hypothetical protein